MTKVEMAVVEAETASRGVRRTPLFLLAPALLGLLGMIAVLVLTARKGPGVTPDSVSYLAAARSLLDGEGLRGPDGEPLVAFPPLFPAMIAAVSLGVFDLVDAARALVAVSFGLTVCVTGWAAGRISGSWVWAALAAAALLVSEPVLVTALHVWSEAPFMALAVLSLAALPSPALRAGRLALAAGALAALTRYIGVVLPLTQGGVALVTGARDRRARRVVVALLGLLPLVLWLVRNLAVSDSLLGERAPAAATLAENARAATEVLLRWLVPLDLAMRWRALLVLVVALPFLAALTFAARRGEPDARRLLWAVLPFALYAGLLAGYLVLGATMVAVDPIDGRLIAPLLPALVVVAAGLMGGARGIGGSGLLKVGRAVAVAAVLVWLALSAVEAGRFLRRVETDGIGGYAGARWAGSETLAHVRDQVQGGTILSNDPYAIAYHLDREARLSPRRHPYRAPQRGVDDLPALADELGAGTTVYLVWFDGVPRDFLLSLSDLEAILNLEPLVRGDDGSVYRVTGQKR